MGSGSDGQGAVGLPGKAPQELPQVPCGADIQGMGAAPGRKQLIQGYALGGEPPLVQEAAVGPFVDGFHRVEAGV